VQQNQSVDPYLREPFGGIKVNPATRRDTDFKVFKPPAGSTARLLEPIDALGCAVEVQGEAEPSFCQPGSTAVGVFRMAAEDNFGVWFLHRPRHCIDSLERNEAALVCRLRH